MQIPEVWEEGRFLFCQLLFSIDKAALDLLLSPIENEHQNEMEGQATIRTDYKNTYHQKLSVTWPKKI